MRESTFYPLPEDDPHIVELHKAWREAFGKEGTKAAQRAGLEAAKKIWGVSALYVLPSGTKYAIANYMLSKWPETEWMDDFPDEWKSTRKSARAYFRVLAAHIAPRFAIMSLKRTTHPLWIVDGKWECHERAERAYAKEIIRVTDLLAPIREKYAADLNFAFATKSMYGDTHHVYAMLHTYLPEGYLKPNPSLEGDPWLPCSKEEASDRDCIYAWGYKE